MSELETLGAYLWEQVGRKPTPPREFVNLLSMDLRWFRPEDAKEVVGALVTTGLFSEQGERLVGGEKLAGLQVPRGFRPTPGLLEFARKSQVAPLLDRILEKIPEGPGTDGKSGALGEAKELVSTLGIPLESAALLVAWRHGVRDRALLEEYESSQQTPRPDDEN